MIFPESPLQTYNSQLQKLCAPHTHLSRYFRQWQNRLCFLWLIWRGKVVFTRCFSAEFTIVWALGRKCVLLAPSDISLLAMWNLGEVQLPIASSRTAMQPVRRLNGVISFLFSIPFALFRAKRARQRVTGSQQLSNNCNCNCGCICKQNACNIPTNPLDLGTKLLFLFNLVSGQNCCPVRVYATTVPLFGSEFDFSSYFWPCKAYRKAE